MDCAQARFLLYAYQDRDLSPRESEALARHLSRCAPCQERSRSARGVVRLLRSRLDRAAAPQRLRIRLHNGEVTQVRPRYTPMFAAAAVILALVPTVSSVSSVRSVVPAPAIAVAAAPAIAVAAALMPSTLASASTDRARAMPVSRVTGTVVCLDCDSRQEAGLCPLPHARHAAGICADNGEVWRLMTRDNTFLRAAEGQTVTVEGIAFPRSGFLRASRVGY